jgi:hypothetical protein
MFFACYRVCDPIKSFRFRHGAAVGRKERRLSGLDEFLCPSEVRDPAHTPCRHTVHMKRLRIMTPKWVKALQDKPVKELRDRVDGAFPLASIHDVSAARALHLDFNEVVGALLDQRLKQYRYLSDHGWMQVREAPHCLRLETEEVVHRASAEGKSGAEEMYELAKQRVL